MKRLLLIIPVLIALPFLARAFTAINASGRVYARAEQTPGRSAAIVFGAGVRNGYPSAILYDRVATAVELYQAGKVSVLLMSGDSRFVNYDETAVMRRVAIQLGVPAEAIQIDKAGRSTYDTCFRARALFDITDAVLVTQRFHLDRAITLCDGLGINAVGLAADRRSYRAMRWYDVREIGATFNALIELWVTRPQPLEG
jgi:SanA protein